MNQQGNIKEGRTPLLATIIGTGFGSGFWPWGPGTAGSILAVAIWMLLSLLLPTTTLQAVTFALAFAFTILGTWATAQLQPFWGDDPSRVVIDEMVGVWIPLSLLCPGDYYWALAALVVFRFFDIVKPIGIKRLDRRKGAVWVMLDDILGGIYTMIVLIIAKVIWLI